MFRIKRILSNLTISLCGIIIILVAFEIYLRIFHYNQSLGIQSYFDDNLGVVRFIPNQEYRVKYPEFEYILKTNSKGLRDYEYPYEKNKNVFRIVAIGDSFTFGHGVELKYTFPKQLENKLKKRFLPKMFEVINMGMVEYGTSDCYKFLVNEGYRYNPDLVIYGFFMNDFDDMRRKVKKQKNDSISQNIDAIRLASSTFNFKRFLGRSYLYHFLLGNIKKIAMVRNFLYLSGISNYEGPLYYLEDYILYKYNKDTERVVNLCLDYMLRMKRYCNNMGAEFVVVYIPDYFQVHHKILQKNKGKLYKNKYDIDKPQNLIFEFCKAKDIDYVDTTPFLQKKAKSKRLYYDSDQHFTKEGHSIIARVLVDRLRNKTGYEPEILPVLD